MTSTSLALLGFVSWMLALTLTIGGQRVFLSLSGQRAANSFSPSGEDVSPFSARVCRAHANCYEHFGIFGGLLLFALATNQTAVTDPLALVFLAARLLQSLVHIASTSTTAVTVRFGFFAVQVVIAIIWIIGFLSGPPG
jgi:hypothetical protein